MDPYYGMILQTGFSFAVKDWSTCAGQIIDISQNQTLYALIGTIYGGDGRSSMKLPDLRGRTPLGYGQGPGLSYNYIIGMSYGFEYTQIGIANMPQHTHTHSYTGADSSLNIVVHSQLSASTQDSTTTIPENGAYLATSKEVGSGKNDYLYLPSSSVDQANKVSLGGVNSTASIYGDIGFDNTSFNIFPTGLGSSFNNMQPFEVTNFQMCTNTGLFPSRN